jgi:hypothetical protein
MRILAMCMETGWPPFPGAVTEWNDEDLSLALGGFGIKQDAELEMLEKSKAEAAEAAAQRAKQGQPPGTKSGGGAAGRTSALPIQTPVIYEED